MLRTVFYLYMYGGIISMVLWILIAIALLLVLCFHGCS